MSNIAEVLKQEITRLARKEVKTQTEVISCLSTAAMLMIVVAGRAVEREVYTHPSDEELQDRLRGLNC